jgi:hypothetical protein
MMTYNNSNNYISGLSDGPGKCRCMGTDCYDCSTNDCADCFGCTMCRSVLMVIRYDGDHWCLPCLAKIGELFPLPELATVSSCGLEAI